MYKVSEYYCNNHTILSCMTNQSTNQTSVNTQDSLTCNKNTSAFLFKDLIQAKILTNGDYFMTKREKLSKCMHKINS